MGRTILRARLADDEGVEHEVDLAVLEDEQAQAIIEIANAAHRQIRELCKKHGLKSMHAVMAIGALDHVHLVNDILAYGTSRPDATQEQLRSVGVYFHAYREAGSQLAERLCTFVRARAEAPATSPTSLEDRRGRGRRISHRRTN